MGKLTATPNAQLDGFIKKYSPEIASQGRAVLAKMRRLVPGAHQIVYDNYNFLVVGFGPSERSSEAILSVAFAPRWITIFFLQNPRTFADPHKLLRGSGGKVRGIRLSSPKDLDMPPVRALLKQALDKAPVRIDPKGRGALEIRSVSAKQRPRRPS
jgi:hypothetical protein